MKKAVMWTLVLLGIVVIALRYSNKAEQLFFGINDKSGISIQSTPDNAAVFIDNKEAGKTPFEDNNLTAGEIAVKIDKDGASWLNYVKLTGKTVTVINRDLAKDIASSSGEVLTLDKGKGITVISNPSDAGVEIDGKAMGNTPITLNIDSGDHTVLVTHQNYLNRSIKATLPNDFNLTISVDLALSEADLTTIAVPVISQTPEVVVKKTPTGFLRVRDQASLNGKEIGQVNSGDKLILLEEFRGWDRVKLTDGTEGFVSSAYVEKATQ